ncbi:MAG: ABC transporter permease subunit, partial [Lachnospiraceae bacterium]|nr:ABC transporter permease subunit [Lachnospiraceae bacterium]
MEDVAGLHAGLYHRDRGVESGDLRVRLADADCPGQVGGIAVHFRAVIEADHRTHRDLSVGKVGGVGERRAQVCGRHEEDLLSALFGDIFDEAVLQILLAVAGPEVFQGLPKAVVRDFDDLLAPALGEYLVELGAVAAYKGGRTDNIIMRLNDILISIPPILMALAIVASLGTGAFNIIVAVSIACVPRFARVIRATVLT